MTTFFLGVIALSLAILATVAGILWWHGFTISLVIQLDSPLQECVDEDGHLKIRVNLPRRMRK